MTTATPLSHKPLWLCWTGMETDLIFNEGVELPGFAAFPLLDSDEGRARLARYAERQIAIARDTGAGVVLDTPTWMANPDRGALVGYAPGDLLRVTREGVAMLRAIAAGHPGVATCVSVQIGPRGDGYAAGIATFEAAEAYHRPQVEAARAAGADLVSAYTLGSIGEAVGIARAARAVGIPAIVSYTVETDGLLADGTPLGEAVARLAEDGAPMAIMVNCAHPDHIAPAFDGGAWEGLLSGVVANASRLSHAELDNATELDAGDPVELAGQLAAMRHRHRGISLLGGCCGTDLRHIREIAAQAMAALA